MHRLSNMLRLPPKIIQNKKFHSLIDISAEIRESIKLKKPVVALESTIITHGMPYPNNIEMAVEVENIIRDQVRKLKMYCMWDHIFMTLFYPAVTGPTM